MEASPWNVTPTPWTPFDLWADLYTDHLRRIDALVDEVGKRNSLALEQADSALGETARAGADSMAVARQISEDYWRTVRGATWWLSGLAWPRWARPTE